MEKKPNLFIHTGTHKTGTTAIQRFLKANRKAFERKGFGIAGLTRSERAQIKQSADDIQENAKTTEGRTQSRNQSCCAKASAASVFIALSLAGKDSLETTAAVIQMLKITQTLSAATKVNST